MASEGEMRLLFIIPNKQHNYLIILYLLTMNLYDSFKCSPGLA